MAVYDEPHTMSEKPRQPTSTMYGEILDQGAVVGAYIVDSVAVEGGFSAIYRARRMRDGQIAALKVLSHDLAHSIRAVERFQREFDILTRLSHRNIVDIFQIGDLPDGRPFIAMEWLEGRNLADELHARGPFTPREALATLEPVCAAVSAAHRQGVIHRDLKAQNIMALPDGKWFRIKLVDFGIAKLIEPSREQPWHSTHSLLGTPLTMAPEQIRRGVIDARTDIYALGLLLYQLLTERLPFMADNLIAIEQMHLQAPPPRVSDRVSVPPGIDDVICRALQKNREDRYASVDEFLADAQEAMSARLPMGAQAGEETRATLPAGDQSQQGIGLYVELRRDPRADGPGDDSTGDDLLDDVLDLVAESAENAGMSVVLHTIDAVLAVSSLPADPDEDAARRLAIVSSALALAASIANLVDGTGLCATIVAHCAEARGERSGPASVPANLPVDLIEGPLLHLAEWPRVDAKADSPLAVYASSRAIAGLAAFSGARPACGQPDLHDITP